MFTFASIFIFLTVVSNTGSFLSPAVSSRTCRLLHTEPLLKVISNRKDGQVRSLPDSDETQGSIQDDEDQRATVFDAEGAVSWKDYEMQKSDAYELTKVDEMLCWEFDECPVSEDQEKAYTMRWQIRSGERTPTMVTHFDSEGDWEEEDKSAWSRKWFEDVGGGDRHGEVGRDLINGDVNGHIDGQLSVNVNGYVNGYDI